MKKWMSDGLKGWLSCVIVMVWGDAIHGHPFFESLWMAALAGLIAGAIPGIIGGKYIKPQWGPYVAGAILPLLLVIPTLEIVFN